jgi:hypothetical protein
MRDELDGSRSARVRDFWHYRTPTRDISHSNVNVASPNRNSITQFVADLAELSSYSERRHDGGKRVPAEERGRGGGAVWISADGENDV